MNDHDRAATRMSLLLRVRDLNDAAAWRDFVACYTPGIYAWCKRMGLQEADAADASQTVLLKLVDSLNSFQYDAQRGRFRGWLKTVTQNVAIDMVRVWKERAAGGELKPGAEPSTDLDPATMLDIEIDQGYRQELLCRASTIVQMKVKPTTWQAWQLSSDVSLAAADVARQLGISVGDVYVSKSRVLKMLRDETRRLEAEDDAVND